MKKRFTFPKAGLAFVLIALASLACNFPVTVSLNEPTAQQPSQQVPLSTAIPPTPLDTQAVPTNCLIGTWDVGDLGPYMKAVIPPEDLQGASLDPKGSTGSLRYTFNKDGSLVASANQYQVNADVKVSFLSLPLAIKLDGRGTASYQADLQANKLMISNPDTAGLSADATLAGNSVMDSSQIAPFLWFGATQDSMLDLDYQCNGDQLSFIPPPASNGTQIPPLTFTRVSP